ncbi:MAG: hypothetical protein NZV14_05760 [Bryobacteraceae bacterium]|nr:hypothetical protein [Bryobacteraceae bacterium]MDW8377645.1 hypothetical protein [Bryobacterales bacterium]
MIFGLWALLWPVVQASPLVLENDRIRLVIETAGGSFVEFRLKNSHPDVNPFTWQDRGSSGPRPQGHFLCLDRWGQPSERERVQGMPFHGEASRVHWTVQQHTPEKAVLRTNLPLAGLHVQREVILQEAAVLVTEWVTNQNKLGRVYNMVQHPTIGPPFLDETTVVDANARQGFMQSSPLPNPELLVVFWPQAWKDAQPVDMRRLHSDPQPNVVSYVLDEELGWTTALNPSLGLLLGYVWKSADYPWFNAWRHVENGKPAARGLEFGTTGLHQPFSILVKKGTIFGRAIFSYLDAGETVKRQFEMFLAPVSKSVSGVVDMRQQAGDYQFSLRGGGELRVKALLKD